jgi:hypothetical protein
MEMTDLEQKYWVLLGRYEEIASILEKNEAARKWAEKRHLDQSAYYVNALAEEKAKLRGMYMVGVMDSASICEHIDDGKKGKTKSLAKDMGDILRSSAGSMYIERVKLDNKDDEESVW